MVRSPSEPEPHADVGFIHYVDTTARKIVESIPMRVFSNERGEYVRLYELSRELELNPEYYKRLRGID